VVEKKEKLANRITDLDCLSELDSNSSQSFILRAVDCLWSFDAAAGKMHHGHVETTM